MHISQNGVDFIKGFEGYHKALPDGNCTTYYCPSGVLTIGYGCTEGISPGEVWTPQQAEDALRREIAKHEQFVQNYTKGMTLTQAQYDMLVSFCYNCGPGNLRKLLSHDDVANALPLFNRGSTGVLPGLVRRRADERKIYLNGYRNDQGRDVGVSTKAKLVSEISKSSTKASVLRKWYAALTAFFASFLSADFFQVATEVVDKVKEFASANVVPILCVVGLLLFIGKKWFETKQAKDAMERGYVPSKMEEADAVASE